MVGEDNKEKESFKKEDWHVKRPQGREDREGPVFRRGAGKAHLEEKIWKPPDHEPCTPGSDFRNSRDKKQPQMPPADFFRSKPPSHGGNGGCLQQLRA